MSAKPKIYLYLVHEETGQKYPVSDEVVIGRNAGEICFPDDAKMSSQHCRIITTPQGLGIHDMASANGTYLDGVKLQKEKMYALKPGSKLTVADQSFKTLEPSTVKKVKPRKRRSKKRRQESDFTGWLASVFLLAAIGFVGYSFVFPADKSSVEFTGKITTPFEMVEKDVKAAMNEYAELGRNHAAKKISDKDLSDGIRTKLIPKLEAAQAKMTVIKPTSEYERRKLAANKTLLSALLKQVDVIALSAATHDEKLAPEIARLSAIAEEANHELEKVEASREPARYDY
jgi:pSer/pThr/pTyr-binding forkhead associated (FHA) protein